MKYDWLSSAEIDEAILQTTKMIQGVDQYLAFIATGGGLPQDPLARSELVASYQKIRAKLERDLEDLHKAAAAQT